LFKKYTPVAALCTLLWLSLPVLSAETGVDYANLPTQVCPEPPIRLDPAVRTVAGGMFHRDLWRASDSLRALATELRTLADDGLYPDQYHLSWLESRRRGDDLDTCEALLASQILVQALSDLTLGRVDPHRAELVWYRHPMTDEDRVRALSALVASGDDPQALIQAARPAFAPYQHLRAAYVAARDNPPRDPWPEIPAGPSLREGDTGERVALLRARLAAEGYTAAEAAVVEHFDVGLGDAVKVFQLRHGLAVDGVAGRKTLAELNRDAEQRVARMRVNLERMRWLARDMAPRTLVVDVTAARVMYYRGGELAWTSRAQMGMASRATPALVSSLTHVTLNPTWTVPPTILRNDKLPEIRRDISYLTKNRLKVLDREGNVLDPGQVDWSNPGGIILRQDAGPRNALGRIAFRFPNPFAVYLHDTPNQHLFDSGERFFSSGCVRIKDAMTMADLLFSDGGDERKAEFSRVLESGRTGNLNLPQPVPLIMGYWTAEADAQGQVFFRPDVYDLDQALLSLLQKK